MPESNQVSAGRPGDGTRYGRRTYRVNYGRVENDSAELARIYASAAPFPHIVIDDLVAIDADALDEFPTWSWDGWTSTHESYQAGKVTCNRMELIPPSFAALIDEFSQPRMLTALERIVGISGLIPDPYLEGGGLHMSGEGGILTPHTDFHVHPRLGLFRRLNVILYLEPYWEASFGGCLELHGEEPSQTVTVTPLLGRVVVFGTTDRSIHGFPVPIRAGLSRRSVALYYYTQVDSGEFGGLLTTDWRDHPSKGVLGRVRVGAYRALLAGSRGFAVAAHLANPNQGIQLAVESTKTRLARSRRG